MELNSADQAFKADPYPLFAALRAAEPIARVTLNGMPGWFVTSFDLVRELLGDARLSSNPVNAGGARSSTWQNPDADSPFARQIVRLDAPDHTRLRALMAKAFTPRRIEQLRSRVQEITDGLLDEVVPGAEVDLMAAFANQLPLIVIMEILGMPPSARGEFMHWVELVMSNDPEVAHLAAEGWQHVLRHLRALVDSKRGNAPDTDVLSAFAAAREEGDRMDDDELVSAALVLLLAGYTTTVDLIGLGVLELAGTPGLVPRARADVPAFVEELLRHSTSIQMPVPRFALEDVTVTHPGGEVLVAKGEAVFLSIPAANRDPERFPDPDAFDLGRETSHLAFGFGRHFCLGAHLARLEAETAFRALLERFAGVELAVDRTAIAWKMHPNLRGPVTLPVRLQSTLTSEINVDTPAQR